MDAAVPQAVPDKQAHCLASAAIAWRCSVMEAYGAGIAKEIKDMFGHGDAEWADLRADAAGVRCARSAHSESDIRGCCEKAVRSEPGMHGEGAGGEPSPHQ